MPGATERKDYYKVLEISKYASEEEVRTAYKKMALRYHPDRNIAPLPSTHHKFVEIQEAYRIIIERRERRRRSKESRPSEQAKSRSTPKSASSPPSSGTESSSSSSGWASSNKASSASSEGTSPPSSPKTTPKPPPRRRAKLRKARPVVPPCNFSDNESNGSSSGFTSESKQVQITIRLTLSEFFHGTTIPYRITRRLSPEDIKNRKKADVDLEIKVRPCRAGSKIIYRDIGDRLSDGSRQDVIFILEEIPHDQFTRIKDNLVLNLNVPTLPKSRTGEESHVVCIEGIDGNMTVFSIPYPKSKDDKVEGSILIEGAGMCVMKGVEIAGRGDLTVKWQLAPSKWDSFKKIWHLDK